MTHSLFKFKLYGYLESMSVPYKVRIAIHYLYSSLIRPITRSDLPNANILYMEIYKWVYIAKEQSTNYTILPRIPVTSLLDTITKPIECNVQSWQFVISWILKHISLHQHVVPSGSSPADAITCLMYQLDIIFPKQSPCITNYLLY
jgi:hypothetical protein